MAAANLFMPSAHNKCAGTERYSLGNMPSMTISTHIFRAGDDVHLCAPTNPSFSVYILHTPQSYERQHASSIAQNFKYTPQIPQGGCGVYGTLKTDQPRITKLGMTLKVVNRNT